MKQQIIIFQNTRSVITAEKLCLAKNIKVKLIPVPKNISSECGICMEITADFEAIVEILNENNIQYTITEK